MIDTSRQAVADTGFIVALTNTNDTAHVSARQNFIRFEQIFLPQSTLTEILFLIRRDAGTATVINFLDSLYRSRLKLTCLNDQDIKRTIQLLKQYQDSRIDFVDASVMAMAERLEIRNILTLDRRDFSLVRPAKWDYFEPYP
ncbi:MAG: PIN domain-containing protein [Chloroflexi bacterium]|nr:PIN domain-containing protein [Chloroflexota bacterium]